MNDGITRTSPSQIPMKRYLILLLTLFTINACAEPDEQQQKLAVEMQQAVLRTQDVQKAKEIVSRGFDINGPIGCGTFSSLDGAIHKEDVEMLKFLLAHGAKPRGRELADAAFASGYQQAEEMVAALLKAGVDVNTRNEHSAPLIRATYRRNAGLVSLLLAQPGIKLEQMNSDGDTALMCAVRGGSSELVDLLLRAGADPKTANAEGETAATVAQQEIQKQQAIMAKLQSGSKGVASP